MKRNRIKRWGKTFAIAVLLAVIFRGFFFTSYIVEGQSMVPTLKEGNLLVVNKIEYTFSEIDRFDVVVFHANKTEDYVKRVVGLPGDEIVYQNDTLYINGQPYAEPYLHKNKQQILSGKLTGDFTLKELTGFSHVPDGQLFVIGDNRRGSHDSRHFGFVPMGDIVGKVNLRYWPVNQWAISFR